MKLKTTGITGLIFEHPDLEQLGLPEYTAFADTLAKHQMTLRDCSNIRSNHGLRDENEPLPDSLTQDEKDVMLAYFAFICAFYDKFDTVPHISQIGQAGDIYIWLSFSELFTYTNIGDKLQACAPINLSNIDPLI